MLPTSAPTNTAPHLRRPPNTAITTDMPTPPNTVGPPTSMPHANLPDVTLTTPRVRRTCRPACRGTPSRY
jgi:hypothetical protein